MRVRTICAGLAIAVASILLPGLAVSVAAASQGVATSGSGCPGSNLGWNNQSPFTATINPGDTVTWSNCAAGYHYLQSTSGGWCLGNQATTGAAGTPWSYSCKFTTPGRFSFWCGVHTTGMAGTIVVMGTPPPPPPPPPAPAPTHAPAPVPTYSQAPPTPSPAVQRPTPPAAPSPTPTPEVVALTASPSPSDAVSPSPSSAPTVAPAPASSSGSGSPLPVILLVAVVASLGGGAFYWYRNRRPI